MTVYCITDVMTNMTLNVKCCYGDVINKCKITTYLILETKFLVHQQNIDLATVWCNELCITLPTCTEPWMTTLHIMNRSAKFQTPPKAVALL